MTTLRKRLIRLAATLPLGPERTALVQLVAAAQRLQKLDPSGVSNDIIKHIGGVASQYRPLLGIIKSGISSSKTKNPGIVTVSYDLHDKDRDTTITWQEDFKARWSAVLDAAQAAGYSLIANPLGDAEWDQAAARQIALQTGVVGLAKVLSEDAAEAQDTLLEQLRQDMTRFNPTSINGYAADDFRAHAVKLLRKKSLRELKELAILAGVRRMPRLDPKRVTIPEAIANTLIQKR